MPGLHIRFLGHLAVLILPTLGIPYGGEKFTNLILRLYFMRGSLIQGSRIRISLIKKFTNLIHRLFYLDFRLFCITHPIFRIYYPAHLNLPAQYLMRGRVIYQEVYAPDTLALLLGLPTILPSVLMWGRVSPIKGYAMHSIIMLLYHGSRI